MIFLCAFRVYSQKITYTAKKIPAKKSYTFRTGKIGPCDFLNKNFLGVKGKVPGRPDLTFIYSDSLNESGFKYLVRISAKRNNTRGKSAEDFQIWADKIKPLKEYSDKEFITLKIIKSKNEFVLIKKFKKTLYNEGKDSMETARIAYVIINEKYKNELILIDITEVDSKIDLDKTIDYFDEFVKEIKPIKPYYNKKWDANFLFALTVMLDERESGFRYRYYSDGWRGATQTIQMNFNGTGISFGRHLFDNFWLNARFTGYGNARETQEEYFADNDTTGIPTLYNSVFERSSISTMGLYAEKRIFVHRKASVDLDLGVVYASDFNFTFIERTAPSGPTTEHKVYYGPSAGFEWGAKYRVLFANHNCGMFLGLRLISLKHKYNKYTIDGSDSNLRTAKYFIPKIEQLNFSGVQFFFGCTYQFPW